jgi:polar amino acid transport system substrate-binding protein
MKGMMPVRIRRGAAWLTYDEETYDRREFVRRILLLASLLIAISIPGGVSAQPAISSEIAPLGKLRVATNGGNPQLVTRTPDGKMVGGVALDVGKFVAAKLGVSFEAVAYVNADAYTQSFGKREWDIAIGPRTPLVAEKAEFSPDLILSDLMYVAAPGREFADAGQVDRPGVKIGVGRNSGADQFLSRTLKSAELVRPGGGGVEALRSGKADVWGANASNVQGVADGLPGAKVVPGAFTTERYTVALPKGRSSAAQDKLAEIVNEAKRTGIVQKAIEEAGLKGVRVAPN